MTEERKKMSPALESILIQVEDLSPDEQSLLIDKLIDRYKHEEHLVDFEDGTGLEPVSPLKGEWSN